MSKRDYYEVLGVSRSATPEQIKRAYRELSKKYHPDRNPDDGAAETRFKEVQQAYDVLKDPAKRSEYDRFGDVAVGSYKTGPQGEQVYTWGGGSTVNVEDLADLFSTFGFGDTRAGAEASPSIFEQILGGRGRRRGTAPPRAEPQRGADAEKTLRLTFRQAVEGAAVTVRLRSGSDQRTETLEVRIPPGVADGQRIRLEGKGHPGVAGGGPGDMFIICQVEPHPFFRREGADLHLDLPVTLSEAVLGAKIDVPTLEGAATVNIPPGTASHARLRLRGKGGPSRTGSDRGDLYITIQIVPPRQPTDAQRQLMERFRDTGEGSPRSGSAWQEVQA